MKKENNKKRWIYDLTEKQVYKIIAVVEILLFIVMGFIIATRQIWTNEQVLEQNGMDKVTLILFTMAIFFGVLGVFGMLIWVLLWENPKKQLYLLVKKHNERVLMVKEKFGLNSDFIEVVPKLANQELQYFAKETEDGILIIQKDKDRNELELELIKDYNYFDLNYEPKIM